RKNGVRTVQTGGHPRDEEESISREGNQFGFGNAKGAASCRFRDPAGAAHAAGPPPQFITPPRVMHPLGARLRQGLVAGERFPYLHGMSWHTLLGHAGEIEKL